MDLAGRLRPTSRSLKKALRLLKHWIFSNRDVETVGLVKFQQCYKWASLALEASYPLSALAGFTKRIPKLVQNWPPLPLLDQTASPYMSSRNRRLYSNYLLVPDLPWLKRTKLSELSKTV